MKPARARATQLSLLEMREPTPPAPHPPLVLDRKTKKRDAVLTAMDRTRAELIEIATETAVLICNTKGWVSSVDVMRAMRTHPRLQKMLDAVDPRWIAAVLLPSKGWIRLEGTISIGSRGRPVARWTRKT